MDSSVKITLTGGAVPLSISTASDARLAAQTGVAIERANALVIPSLVIFRRDFT